jgi:hypothetical protein
MNTSPSPVLPEPGDERVDRIEKGVFRRIADERRRAHRRRVRVWSGAAAAAAVVVVAAVIAPGLTLRTASTESAAVAPATGFAEMPEGARDAAGGAAVSDGGGAVSDGSGAGSAADAAAAPDGRDIVATGSATITTADVAEAIRRIAEDATARGGYVETQSVDGSEPAVRDDMVVAPYPPAGGWITVRVPADELSAAMDALGAFGEVTASSVSRQDVTDQSIDLQARIAASEASVARLTELMAQAADVGDLIAAESALSERQATLEADRQQLAALQSQVSLSALNVQVVPSSTPVEADPAGFGDGVAAGWNGLVATLNGIVVAIGFLLPWLAVAAVAAAVVWGVVRLVRRGRRARPTTPE